MKKTLESKPSIKNTALRVKVATPRQKTQSFYSPVDEQGVNRVKSRKVLLIFSFLYVIALVVLLYKIL